MYQARVEVLNDKCRQLNETARTMSPILEPRQLEFSDTESSSDFFQTPSSITSQSPIVQAAAQQRPLERKDSGIMMTPEGTVQLASEGSPSEFSMASTTVLRDGMRLHQVEPSGVQHMAAEMHGRISPTTSTISFRSDDTEYLIAESQLATSTVSIRSDESGSTIQLMVAEQSLQDSTSTVGSLDASATYVTIDGKTVPKNARASSRERE